MHKCTEGSIKPAHDKKGSKRGKGEEERRKTKKEEEEEENRLANVFFFPRILPSVGGDWHPYLAVICWTIKLTAFISMGCAKCGGANEGACERDVCQQ